uniref:B30.2/SPRY domain-containing protein n=1 Tax=Ditylenchus dipsaci TaxID=166011 RepID=A0A915CN41_9BILA
MRPKSRRVNSPTPTLSSAQESPKSPDNTVCYCKGSRQLGELEVICTTCKKWFHVSCFKDIKEFYALPFMVSYVFHCHDCHPDKKENWTLKNTNFSHMCIMALANMTFDYFKDSEQDVSIVAQPNPKYFNLETEIIPFFESNWENLTSLPRRVKNTWHQTLHRTLSKETELFVVNPADENGFALKEKDLLTIGPLHEAVKQIGRRPATATVVQSSPTAPAAATTAAIASTSASVDAASSADKLEVELADTGPKTRGASKRKTLESSASSTIKKSKTASDFSSVQIEGLNNPVDFPFNREGYRYYLVEKDMTVQNRHLFDAAEDLQQLNRYHPTSTEAHQLKLSDDRLTITGHEGYSIARATHGVSRGCWYFEVDFLSQPEGSHTRIGWSQPFAVLQACLGYTKFSYSWRSLKGTAFHDARGMHYADGGYKQGDTLGCLIELPEMENDAEGFTFSDLLPPSNKEMNLIDFKHNLFFEEKEEVPQALKKLRPLKGSRIEFSGMENLVYPPTQLKSRPNGLPRVSSASAKTEKSTALQPISERAEQIHVEQCLADILYMISEKEEIDKKNKDYFENP